MYWGVGGGVEKCRGDVGKCWGRCEKVCWGVEKVRGDVGRSVGGVGWGSVLRCGGRCRKVCGRGDGVWELKCGGGVGKCWGRCGGVRKFWGRYGKGC